MAIDQDKLNAFLGKAVGDLGAAMSAVLMSIGDELGYYRALAESAIRKLRMSSVERIEVHQHLLIAVPVMACLICASDHLVHASVGLFDSERFGFRFRPRP